MKKALLAGASKGRYAACSPRERKRRARGDTPPTPCRTARRARRTRLTGLASRSLHGSAPPRAVRAAPVGHSFGGFGGVHSLGRGQLRWGVAFGGRSPTQLQLRGSQQQGLPKGYRSHRACSTRKPSRDGPEGARAPSPPPPSPPLSHLTVSLCLRLCLHSGDAGRGGMAGNRGKAAGRAAGRATGRAVAGRQGSRATG